MQKIKELWLKYVDQYDAWGAENKSIRTAKIVIKFFLWTVSLIVFIWLLLKIAANDEKMSTTDFSFGPSSCQVQGINLHGTLLTYIPEHAEGDSFFDYDVSSSEDLVWAIKSMNEDSENVKAILIEVDSGGGLPVAGEEVANAIKASEIPVVAMIRQAGASGAYWAISSADKIFASKNSDVGSIGVTMSYLNNVSKNQKEGYVYENLSAGKYKDSGNPDKALTAEEKALLMRDVVIVHENFIEAISVNRNLPIEKVRAIADGSTVLGEKAKELGLIDDIGGIYEVEAYLEEILGEKPEICWQ
jgi:protease-4